MFILKNSYSYIKVKFLQIFFFISDSYKKQKKLWNFQIKRQVIWLIEHYYSYTVALVLIDKNFMWWMGLAMFKVKIKLQDKGNCLIQKPAVCLIKILAHKW